MTRLRKFAAPAVALVAAALLTACASKAPTGPASGAGAADRTGNRPVALVASPPGTSGTPGKAVPTLPQRTWPSGMPPGQPGLDLAAHDVETAVKTRFADSYTGLYLQQPTGPDDKTQYAILVYRLPNPALDAAARAAAPGTNLVFVDAEYSYVQCAALMDAIPKDDKFWAAQSFRPNTMGCYPTGVLKMGVADPDKWRAVITARYGPEVEVYQQGPLIGGPLVTQVTKTP